MKDALYREALETPVGRLALGVDGQGTLVEILLPNRRPPDPSSEPLSPRATQGMRTVRQQLNEYFSGKRRAFDVPLRPVGSSFERQVWNKLLEIPYGDTASYGAIAIALGLINGARAVGRANGANPIPIVIPCHRVIGSDGTLTGYGGGLPIKRALLELEGAIGLPEPELF